LLSITIAKSSLLAFELSLDATGIVGHFVTRPAVLAGRSNHPAITRHHHGSQYV